MGSIFKVTNACFLQFYLVIAKMYYEKQKYVILKFIKFSGTKLKLLETVLTSVALKTVLSGQILIFYRKSLFFQKSHF